MGLKQREISNPFRDQIIIENLSINTFRNPVGMTYFYLSSFVPLQLKNYFQALRHKIHCHTEPFDILRAGSVEV